MYDNLKNYATKALIVSALLGGNSVMMPAFAAGEHGMAAPALDGRVKGTVTDAKGEPLTGVVVRVVGADVSYAAVTDIGTECCTDLCFREGLSAEIPLHEFFTGLGYGFH